MAEIIKIRNLEYVYPDGTRALKGVNLDISKGESVGLIGPNGAGKSTLLLHLNGILKGTKGSVEVLGMRVEDKNLAKIRRKVAIVFQEPDDQLFMPTVFDDVAFGPVNSGYSKEKVKEKVKKALRQVRMEGYEDRCSHHLSLGEKKKISIATVLSMDPEILILDEPTISLDPGARRELIKLLKDLNITKIIAGHDLELIVEICSRVVLLDEGEIVTNGDPREVLSNKSLMELHGLEVPLSLCNQ
ncbi:MAG TPA: ATP-binding cassette domain-containing protein [Candidatus Aerophobetes bacterium]|uniref:ATP-binding cassette domain-containing protein n=1 Tax=Aerophobetes bacterium TaxID=2030807 RepID=A0A7V5HZ25_UNCAE|nr:ATP-binding cassette domain-containing protein [Candidatus Aerophobetes bacterium]